MTSMAEHTKKVAALRQEAAEAESAANPRVAYFASWLVFYIDQHQKAIDAWQESIDRMKAR